MNKENENIIGMEYIPTDNSWCENFKTHAKAYITSTFNIGENNAIFTIISMPYEKVILTPMGPKIYTFVNVKSNKTGNIYKVLYRESNIVKTNMDKEIKITPPERYEIDRENSTFECIKEKKWRDNIANILTGYYIEKRSEIIAVNSKAYCPNICENYNVFATKKQAKSALAMARISQIMANDKRFGGVVTDEEWDNSLMPKYCIYRCNNHIVVGVYITIYYFLAFHTKEQRDLFLEENIDLIKDYLMIVD